MLKYRWLVHLIMSALAHRRGRTILLLAVLTMAASLATALDIVTGSMEKRVAEEIRKFGANLVIVPPLARIDVGSGGLSFGVVSEPAYLDQRQIDAALAGSGVTADRSYHLRGTLRLKGVELPAEGVTFPEIRRLFPWWQMRGSWPAAQEVVVGSDLAQRTGLKPGDPLSLSGPGGELHARVSALVTTGGEEDGLLFVALPELQRMRGDDNRLTMVRLLVTSTGNSVGQAAAALKPLLPRAEIKAVRQVAHTSEGLLRKIQLLMLLVTVVVLVSAGSSVASTMSATVLERGKEIGLMKAVGGSRGDLLLIFAGEALLLGLAGGAAGWLCGNAIAQFVTRAVFSAPAEIIPSGLLVSWGVSLFLCILGSVVPMMSVFRLDPVRSLRGE